MKIILIRVNHKSHIVIPPLGIGYLASYLKKEGIEAKIIDGLRDNLTNEQILEKVLLEKPDAAGISCLTASYDKVVALSRLFKEKNLRCIIGGVHPTFLPYSTLRDTRADFVICGEGEVALSSLLRNNFNQQGIRGVYSLKDLTSDEQAIEKAEIVEDLDTLPFPDWEELDPNLYPEAPHGAIVKNFPIGNIATSRGCPYECTFCASSRFHDRKIRFRSPENVIAEIKYLIENYGIKEVHFEDDNLTFKRDHIEAICNLMLENKLRITWACPAGIRADKVDEDLIRLMVKSGCYFFAFGIESVNAQILKNIKKHTTIEIVEKAIQMSDRQGISCLGLFIFGLPGETTETINQSINFSRKTKLSRAQFSMLDILPGSELWYTLRGKFKPNWTKNSFKEPEWMPEGLTKKQLMQAQVKAFRLFYLRPSIIFKLIKLIKPGQIKFLLRRLLDYRLI
jgi:anaerobic magnesium-protoporphyrin IX monomethyl ester cyclase